MLTNNNANIRRMKERLVELQRKEAASGQEMQSLNFSGGEIQSDFQEDRIRILYPGKPDAATIGNLKRSGFRWSPTKNGWQRQLTPNAVHDVAALPYSAHKLFILSFWQFGCMMVSSSGL